jgi:sirohydrochlorin cobaltochelatase
LPFENIVRRIRAEQPELALELAFLEHMLPDVFEAGARLAAAGCHTIDVLPLFLGAGGHVRKDVPLLMERLAERHPAALWRLQPTVGEIDAVTAAMASAAIALLAPPGETPT